MIEFNGWISVELDSTFKERSVINNLEQFQEMMKPLIADFDIHNQFIELKRMNGSFVYFIGGSHNHRLSYLESVIEIYEKVAELAPSSYGLLYVRLPEDEAFWNKYRVFRLAKGIITEHEDILLSPCDPVIEDNSIDD